MGNQTSKHNSKDKSKKVHWKSAEPPQAPGKPLLVPGEPTDEPDIVTIRWQKPRNDGGSTIIGYIVEHRRTGSPHWVRACPQMVYATELSLSGLEPGWRYQFRIIAENTVGKSEPSELSDALTVTLQRNAITAPRFTIELEDSIGVENEQLEFKVNVIGTPAPQISWFKDGFEIFSSRRTKIVTENDASILIIYQAALTDEGEIKCTATNRAGYAFSKSKLTIDAPPKIRLPRQYEDGLIIEAEEVIRLKVGIAGRPTPSVIWTHNGEILSSGGRYEIINSDKNSSLKITNSSRSDRGEYNLRAINKLGEDNSSFLVTITARPTPPGQVAIKIVLGKTVTLSWAPPDDDGGCKIGNYIVEYYRVGWGVWLKASTCRQLAVTLNDLIEGSEYKFRVKAENPYGVSDPSDESEVLFIPDVKRGITKPIRDETEVKNNVIEQPLVTPRRKNASPSPARLPSQSPSRIASPARPILKLTEPIKKEARLSPASNQHFNTNIFDDNSMEREMSYGSDDFYRFKEVPSGSLQEKPGLEDQVRQLKHAKNTVKFQVDTEEPEKKTTTENIYENLRFQGDKQTNGMIKDEIIVDNPRTYLDLSRRSGSQAQNIQNSSEFMLVLYPNDVTKNNERTDSFELEMDELISPPPLSQSAPELNTMIPTVPLLRCAVSSTELLYERAMARFYKAVEYEESENARKRSVSVEVEGVRRRSFSADREARRLSINAEGHETALTRLRLNSLTESERRSSLRRRLSGDSSNLPIIVPRKLSLLEDEPIKEVDQRVITKRNTKLNQLDVSSPDLKRSPSPGVKDGVENFSDDYTDSTASSEDTLSEPVVTASRRSRLRADEDLDTYHPPRMLSPYRQPENHEAAEVLTRSLPPLPDPNFVPKPILKRPSSSDDEKTKKKAPDKPERKSLKSLFGRGSKSPSPSPTPSPKEMRKGSVESTPQIIKEIPKPVEIIREIRKQSEPPPEVPEIKIVQPQIEEEVIKPPIVRPIDLIKKKKLEQRQNSEEENHVVAEYYGDMIKNLTARPMKPKIPIYMNPEALKQLELDDDEEEELELTEAVPESFFANRAFSPKRSITPEVRNPYFTRPETPNRPFSPNNSVTSTSPAPRTFSPSPRTFSPPPVVVNDPIDQVNTPTQRKSLPANGDIPRVNEQVMKTNSVDETDHRGRTSRTGTLPKRRNASQSRSRDSSCVRSDVPILAQPRRDIQSQSKTRNRSESKSPATLNPTPSELQEEIEIKVKTTMSYATDLSILIFATYVYFFKHALLALPIILLLLYRQLQDKIPDWMKKGNNKKKS
ncbi:unnamed protein product [Diamesa serratosioi]